MCRVLCVLPTSEPKVGMIFLTDTDGRHGRRHGRRQSAFLQSRTPSVTAREHRFLGRRNSAGLNPDCSPAAQQFVLLFLRHNTSLRLVQPGTTSRTRYPSYAYAPRYVWTVLDGTAPARSRGETPKHRKKRVGMCRARLGHPGQPRRSGPRVMVHGCVREGTTWIPLALDPEPR